MPGPGPPAMPVLGAPPIAGGGGGGALLPATPAFPGGGITLPGLPLTAAGGMDAFVPVTRADEPAIGKAPVWPAPLGVPLTAAPAWPIAPAKPAGPHAGGHAL